MLALVQQSAALVRCFTARAARIQHKHGACAVLRGIIPKNSLYFPGRERFMFFGAGMYCEIPIRISPQEKFLQYFAAGVTSAFPLRTDAVILTQPP